MSDDLEFEGIRFDTGKQIPIVAHVSDGDGEWHKYKFEYADPDAPRDEPGTLQWSGARVDVIDVPDEWLETAKAGIEKFTEYEVDL